MSYPGGPEESDPNAPAPTYEPPSYQPPSYQPPPAFQPPPAYQPPPPTAQPLGPPGAYPPAGYPAAGYPPPGPPTGQPQGLPYPPVGPPGYPPQQPPGYGGYQPGFGGYAPPPKKRRKWPWIVAGTVVVIVAVLVVVGVVFGRKGSGDPHTAADKFWHALVQHDTKKAGQYVCSKKDLTSNDRFKQLVNALTSYDIGAESGTGNTRTYPVTLHLSLAGVTGDQVVVTTVTKDTGKWYVCNLSNQ